MLNNNAKERRQGIISNEVSKVKTMRCVQRPSTEMWLGGVESSLKREGPKA